MRDLPTHVGKLAFSSLKTNLEMWKQLYFVVFGHFLHVYNGAQLSMCVHVCGRQRNLCCSSLALFTLVVLPARMPVYSMHAGCLMRPKQASDLLRVAGGCEELGGCWELNSRTGAAGALPY